MTCDDIAGFPFFAIGGRGRRSAMGSFNLFWRWTICSSHPRRFVGQSQASSSPELQNLWNIRLEMVRLWPRLHAPYNVNGTSKTGQTGQQKITETKNSTSC